MKVQLPKYRRLRRKNRNDQAFVEYRQQRHYLGIYNSPESQIKYRQFLAEIQSTGGFSQTADEILSIIELVARFWVFAKDYYRDANGKKSGELSNYKIAFKPLLAMPPTKK